MRAIVSWPVLDPSGLLQAEQPIGGGDPLGNHFLHELIRALSFQETVWGNLQDVADVSASQLLVEAGQNFTGSHTIVASLQGCFPNPPA